VRALYQQEVDPRADDFVSERAGADAAIRLLGGVTAVAGSDWDLALRQWGSAEASVRIARAGRWRDAQVGVRRYRPHFDLWTIWGAFGAVAHRTAFAGIGLEPTRGVTLGARGEVFEYDETHASAQRAVCVRTTGAPRHPPAGLRTPRVIGHPRSCTNRSAPRDHDAARPARLL
jgi:hypothetical protein